MNQTFVNRLCLWYREEKRDLPWRHTSDPYRIWLSEIMLQQTRVEAVKGYYERFLKMLPTIEALANCPEDQLLKLWEGLGYYNRARNLQKAAKEIAEKYDGRFPADYESILSLAGIGEYTAGAISSIAFGLKRPAVDGNVLRVMARLLNSKENILDASFKKMAVSEASALVEMAENAGEFNQALIELGALICLPNQKPKCGSCPVRDFCTSFREGTTEEVPVRIKKQKRRIEKRTVLLIRSGEETVISKRGSRGLLAGMYEFPSLLEHVGEEAALHFVEEKGLTALHIQRLPEAKHVFSHITWEMIGYEIRVAEGEAEGWIFAQREELRTKYALPTAFLAYAARLALDK